MILSYGRPAAGASIFLGDSNSDQKPHDQGSAYYYRGKTDDTGYFSIPHVRAGMYALYAWPGLDSSIGDVSTTSTKNDIKISQSTDTVNLGSFTRETQGRGLIWQIGNRDRLP